MRDITILTYFQKLCYTNLMKTQESGKSAKTKTGRLKAKLLGTYYGHPIKDMKLICITGTTGKTEVANFVHEILKSAGHPVSIISKGVAPSTITAHAVESVSTARIGRTKPPITIISINFFDCS